MIVDDIESFTERYKNYAFKYADLIMPALKNRTIKIDHSHGDDKRLLPCQHYFRIYALRTERLAERYTVASELLIDMTSLRDELEKTPDDFVDLWLFTMPDGKTISIFENATKRTILGGLVFN